MNIIAHCAGGLCNRINNIINGIYLSQLLNRELYINWGLDNACYCPLEKLFSNDFNRHIKIGTDFVSYSPWNTDKQQAKIKNQHGEFQYRLTFKYDDYQCMHERPNDRVSDKGVQIIEELRSIKSPNLIFSSSVILTEIIPESSVIKILGELIPIPELADQIYAAIAKDNIDHSVIGIHLRKTDYNLLDDMHVINSINRHLESDKKKRFLICSDSISTEEKFKNLYPDNALLVSDKSFLEKIDPGKTDQLFSNLMRTERSVQSALVDMYLLGHTSFEIFSPISTFAQTAFRLNKISK